MLVRRSPSRVSQAYNIFGGMLFECIIASGVLVWANGPVSANANEAEAEAFFLCFPSEDVMTEHNVCHDVHDDKPSEHKNGSNAYPLLY